MPIHQNLHGFPGDPYSLYDNLWIFTSDGFFIAPRTGWYLVSGCGGGAGGGGATTGSTLIGSGGGAGAQVKRLPVFMVAGNSYKITIGNKGTGGVGNNDGTDGTATTIGELLSLGGGIKGLKGVTSTLVAGGAPGEVTLLTASNIATSGEDGDSTATPVGGAGGGPGLTDGYSLGAQVPGAVLQLPGVPGAETTGGNNGNTATGYGGGGSGARNNSGGNKTGGDGAPGILIIEMPAE